MPDPRLQPEHAAPSGPKTPAFARASAFPWPPVLFVGALLLAYGLGRASPLAWPGVDDTPARVIGLGLGIAGIALAVAGVWSLIGHATTVRPDRGSDVLVTAGPYSRFRNPIYLGEVLILFGLAELSKNVWFAAAAVVFAVLVTIVQILPEERHLEARFGDAYRDYKRRSRRWI